MNNNQTQTNAENKQLAFFLSYHARAKSRKCRNASEECHLRQRNNLYQLVSVRDSEIKSSIKKIIN